MKKNKYIKQKVDIFLNSNFDEIQNIYGTMSDREKIQIYFKLLQLSSTIKDEKDMDDNKQKDYTIQIVSPNINRIDENTN